MDGFLCAQMGNMTHLEQVSLCLSGMYVCSSLRFFFNSVQKPLLTVLLDVYRCLFVTSESHRNRERSSFDMSWLASDRTK